ncbi:DUF397 domain-containing protein [Streptomyces sp. NPDC046942]
MFPRRPVRDSKTPASRPLLPSAAPWAGFVEGIKGGTGVHTFG